MTPADTKTTLQDALLEQVEDTMDAALLYARDRPFTTVAVAFVFGFLTGRALLQG